MENKKNVVSSITSYPPVVSVLGHVDHGKTTLLDAIRKSSIASRETGGITQKIGASQIEIQHEGKKRFITFIDTPGHEAFANMRSQGVNAADVVLLIVASDDGIMPQTRESIQKILEAKLPYIVVLTKSDVEGANPDRIKKQLLAEQVMLEGLGGDVPCISVSAKTGEHMQDLLDLIVLVYDMSQGKKDEKADFLAVVIDAKLDKRRGIVASLVIKQGTIATGDMIFVHGKPIGKVRALVDTQARQVKNALPGDAVEMLGLTEVLPAGTPLFTKAMSMLPQVKPQEALSVSPLNSLADFFNDQNPETLPIILKTETSGELEAIKDSLPDRVVVIFEGQGEIGIADVMLAKDSKAIVLGFNVVIAKEAKSLADSEHIFYRTYSIIYELLAEVNDAVKGLITDIKERILGKGIVVARFEGTKDVILGVRVDEGRLALKDKVRIMRKDVETGTSVIVSLKKNKGDVKDVPKNNECGVVISPEVDFQVGDAIIAYSQR